MDDYVNKFRFFIPPILFFSALFLLNPTWSYNLLKYLSENSENVHLIIDIISAFSLVLAIGFIISSINVFFIHIFGWTAPKEYRKCIGYSWKIVVLAPNFVEAVC